MLKRLLIILLYVHSSLNAAPGLEKLPLCATCHGPEGHAPQSMWPHLAGQSQPYLYKQLKDYQEKRRASAIMQTYASLLSENEMIELSKFYSRQPEKSSSKSLKVHKSAENLYKVGRFKDKIPACIACHGVHGQGNGPAKYPKLSHQNQKYLEDQLRAFKTQQRQNDPQHIMQDISSRLSETDIKDIAHYLSHHLD